MTNAKAYQLADKVDGLIKEHFHKEASPITEDAYLNSLSNKKCMSWLLYLRTIQTALDILIMAIEGRMATNIMEEKQESLSGD